ncbi:hypothetical protein AMECASPLE_033218 [Ameca splendens]|uniref:Uncharacterized protein n=1 Tax=Ameca splendens TaxID=208324 RepID=A0ABV0Z6D5_9TELE
MQRKAAGNVCCTTMEPNRNHLCPEPGRSSSPSSRTQKRKPAEAAPGKALSSRRGLFLATAGQLTATAVGERSPQAAATAATTAENSKELVPSSGSAQWTQMEMAQSGSLSKTAGKNPPRSTPKDTMTSQPPSTTEPQPNHTGKGRNVSTLVKAQMG